MVHTIISTIGSINYALISNWAEIMVQDGKVDEAIEIFRRG